MRGLWLLLEQIVLGPGVPLRGLQETYRRSQPSGPLSEMCENSNEIAQEEACLGLGYGFVIFDEKQPLFMGVYRWCFGKSATLTGESCRLGD